MHLQKNKTAHRQNVLVVVMAVLLFAGCSASTGNAHSGTSSSQTTMSPSTASTSRMTPTSQHAKVASASLTVADLRSALPANDAAGPGWSASDFDNSGSGSDSDPMQAVAQKQCPVSTTLMNTNTGNLSNVVGRIFAGANNEQIAIFMLLMSDPNTGFSSQADLDKQIGEVNQCPALTATYQGQTETDKFTATASNQFGDYGATVSGTMQLKDNKTGVIQTTHTTIQIFRVGDAAVTVQTVNGQAKDGSEVPIDPALAQKLAKQATANLEQIQAVH